jgi:hypothetical protein
MFLTDSASARAAFVVRVPPRAHTCTRHQGGPPLPGHEAARDRREHRRGQARAGRAGLSAPRREPRTGGVRDAVVRYICARLYPSIIDAPAPGAPRCWLSTPHKVVWPKRLLWWLGACGPRWFRPLWEPRPRAIHARVSVARRRQADGARASRARVASRRVASPACREPAIGARSLLPGASTAGAGCRARATATHPTRDDPPSSRGSRACAGGHPRTPTRGCGVLCSPSVGAPASHHAIHFKSRRAIFGPLVPPPLRGDDETFAGS